MSRRELIAVAAIAAVFIGIHVHTLVQIRRSRKDDVGWRNSVTSMRAQVLNLILHDYVDVVGVLPSNVDDFKAWALSYSSRGGCGFCPEEEVFLADGFGNDFDLTLVVHDSSASLHVRAPGRDGILTESDRTWIFDTCVVQDSGRKTMQ